MSDIATASIFAVAFLLSCADANAQIRGRRLTRNAAAAERRFALVVGNSTYPSSPLPTGVADAAAVSASLRDVGFTVTTETDITTASLDRSIAALTQNLDANDVSLLYFTGYGAQLDGENYLLPIDAPSLDDRDFKQYAYPLAKLLQQFDKRGRVRIVVLDTSYPPHMLASRGARVVARPGFARTDAHGFLLAFSASPGSAGAHAGSESLSLFAQQFVEALREPGLSASDVFRRIRTAVETGTSGAQVPWLADAISGGDFVFRTHPATAAAPLAVERPADASPTILRAACDAGLAIACRETAERYFYGRGVAVNATQAVAYYQRACTAGLSIACTDAGYMYSSGKGVPRDEARAAAFYRRGCDGGYPLACGNLGFMYSMGRGVPADDGSAAGFYEQGCTRGDSGSCTNWGIMFETGRGVGRDITRAAALYGRGCDGNNLLGCSKLAALLEKGAGVPADLSRALELYRRACTGGDAAACAAARRVGGSNEATR